MGLTALFPLRRKSWYGFLSPLKIHRSRPGLNPRTLGPVASTLPLDHRGQLSNLVIFYVPYRIYFPNSPNYASHLAFIAVCKCRLEHNQCTNKSKLAHAYAVTNEPHNFEAMLTDTEHYTLYWP
jgi:hypothetical protein